MNNKIINIFKNYYFIYYATLDENQNIIGYNNNIVFNWKFIMLDNIQIEKTLLKFIKNKETKDIKIISITKL